MKQKIKIMKPKPELSDQEISSYMDFDGLLAKQKQYTPIPFRSIVRWGILIVLVGGISLWWFSHDDVVQSQDSTSVNEAIVDDTSQRDQPVVEVAPQQSNDKVTGVTA